MRFGWSVGAHSRWGVIAMADFSAGWFPYLDFWVDSQEECVEESEVISPFESFGGFRFLAIVFPEFRLFFFKKGRIQTYAVQSFGINSFGLPPTRL